MTDKRVLIAQITSYMTSEQLKELVITLLNEKLADEMFMQTPRCITHKGEIKRGEGGLVPFPIRIPSAWVDTINKMVKDPDYPYKSFGEFAREAVFRYLKILEGK